MNRRDQRPHLGKSANLGKICRSCRRGRPNLVGDWERVEARPGPLPKYSNDEFAVRAAWSGRGGCRQTVPPRRVRDDEALGRGLRGAAGWQRRPCRAQGQGGGDRDVCVLLQLHADAGRLQHLLHDDVRRLRQRGTPGEDQELALLPTAGTHLLQRLPPLRMRLSTLPVLSTLQGRRGLSELSVELFQLQFLQHQDLRRLLPRRLRFRIQAVPPRFDLRDVLRIVQISLVLDPRSRVGPGRRTGAGSL